jgi:hypothetical protein
MGIVDAIVLGMFAVIDLTVLTQLRQSRHRHLRQMRMMNVLRRAVDAELARPVATRFAYLRRAG